MGYIEWIENGATCEMEFAIMGRSFWAQVFFIFLVPTMWPKYIEARIKHSDGTCGYGYEDCIWGDKR